MSSIMSFWPNVYERIKKGEKTIEYRRSFPKNNAYSYMYVTKPVKAIKAIIYFGEKYTLEELRSLNKDKPDILRQIDNNPGTYRYGSYIIGIKEIDPITLQELRNNVPNFVAPQSYLLLENNPILSKYIEKRRKFSD